MKKLLFVLCFLYSCSDAQVRMSAITSQVRPNINTALPATPSVNATAVSFSSTNSNDVTFNWTNGNGTSRIVLMKALSAVNSNPASGNAYTANSVFGSGTQIGTGNYVVKLGSGPVTVTGLNQDTPYYVAVYEFNGSGSLLSYLTVSPGTSSVITAQKAVSYGSSTGILALGDSYTFGVNASDAAHEYITLLGVYAGGATITNLGVSGVMTNTSEKSANNETNVPNSTTKLMTVMIGLNDNYKNAAAGGTLNKIVQAYRTICINQFRKSSIAAGAAGVTRTGAWSGFAAVNFSGKFGSGANGAVSTTTSGATASYTFTDTNVWVSFIGTDGSHFTYGTVDISLDGVLQSTVNLNQDGNSVAWTDGVADPSNANQLDPVVVGFTGLTNASHTILVTTKNTNTTPIDYFLIMNPPASCAPLVVSEIPFIPAAGYGVQLGSNASASTCNASITAELDYFERLLYPLVYFDMNSFTNITSDISGDNVHRNDAGMAHMATGFESKFNYP